MTPDGTLKTLYSFRGSSDFAWLTSLVQGTDGSFYGIAYRSIFRLTVPGADSPKIVATSRSGSAITLTWLALRSRSYHLQFTTNLTQPNWTNSGSPITATNTTAAASDIVGPDRQRFYRVALLP